MLTIFFYFQVPKTVRKWEEIADSFEHHWNFPNCIGALDGKHVVIKAPANEGSNYYNYKKTHSIVLMALVDAEYKFIYIDVGCSGRNSDGGIFNKCSLAKSLDTNLIGIPPDRELPNALEKVPFVIVADDAFAMKRYLLKPFSQKGLHGAERIFNYRLSRARRVSENAFGIISSRFRVLRKPIELGPEKATIVTMAICALHNYLMTHSKDIYANSSYVDSEIDGTLAEGDWRREENFVHGNSLLALQADQFRNATNESKNIREIFKNYFMTDGEVEWQYKHL